MRRTAWTRVVACFGMYVSASSAQSTITTDSHDSSVVRVINSAEPAGPPQILELRELWRLASDSSDDEPLFGAIKEIRLGGSGDFYLLDSQLKTVHVLSPDGDYRRSIGRGGEGPGEIQWPMGLIISRSARIGVLDAVGQKIVFMRSDGTPDGEWQAILPDEHARLSPLFAWAVPRGILVSCQIRERTDAAAVHRDVIALFGEDRRLAQIACEKSRTHALDQPFVFDEAAMESYSFLAVREDGTVYLSPDFGAYQIDVFDPALHRTMIIERDCPRVRRTPEQVADVRANWEAFYRRVKNAEVRVEEHRRTILSLHPRADGTLWVETSAGWHHHPPNTCVALDVIDASGRFSHQVALAGRIDPWEDYLYLFEDRALVWTGGFSAVQGAIGAADHTPESAEEAEGPTLICYQLVPR